MKTSFLSGLLLVTLTINAYSQKTYFRIHSGYAFPFASEMLGHETTMVIDHHGYYNYNAKKSEKAIYGTYGAGLNFGIAMGVSLSKNTFLDIEYSRIIGKKYISTYFEDYSFTNFYTGTSWRQIIDSNETTYSNSSLVIPSVNHFFNSKKISVSSKIGPILGTSKHYYSYSYESSYVSGSRDNKNLNYHLTGGMIFGLRTGLGLNFKISDNTYFNTELTLNTMKYAPNKKTITKWYEHGSVRDLFIKTTEYRKEVTQTWGNYGEGNNNDNTSREPQELRETFPMTSISINFGFIFLLKRKDQTNELDN